jgi:hypothetical protein
MSPSNLRCYGVHRITLVLATAVTMLTGHVNADTRMVSSGGSIQRAIDAANPGDTIVVSRGTFKEQLLITKDGISILGGNGVTLSPPAIYVTNSCSGLAGEDTEAGICIAGSGLDLDEFVQDHKVFNSATKRVMGVSITGLTITGFSENIAIVGAQDTKVTGAKLVDGQLYGLLTLGSVNTNVLSNTVSALSATPIIGKGMEMDDSASSSQFMSNQISNYKVGILLRTDRALTKSNIITDTCQSIFVRSGTNGTRITGNKLGPAAALGCFSAAGVFVSGGINTLIESNVIRGQRAPSARGRGVQISSDSSMATGNIVKSNAFSNNDIDLAVTTPIALGNVAQLNSCSVGQTCNT